MTATLTNPSSFLPTCSVIGVDSTVLESAFAFSCHIVTNSSEFFYGEDKAKVFLAIDFMILRETVV